MKKLIIAVVAVASLSAFAKETTSTLKVSGWECSGCAKKTESALKEVPGVKAVKIDHKNDTATVTYDDTKAKQADLEKAVASAGFSVEKK